MFAQAIMHHERLVLFLRYLPFLCIIRIHSCLQSPPPASRRRRHNRPSSFCIEKLPLPLRLGSFDTTPLVQTGLHEEHTYIALASLLLLWSAVPSRRYLSVAINGDVLIMFIN